MRTYAIIPAGGKGVRSGFSAPKQYLKFNDKELIAYTINIFQKNQLIDEIILSASPAYFPLLEELKKKYKFTKLIHIIEGGAERQDSVFNGLNCLNADSDDIVAVHDAARPLLPQEVLTNAINTAKEKGNALVCIKARDTLIKGNNNVESYINRDEVYYVQTPQIFKFSQLYNAMKIAYKNNFYGTDESMLVKNAGGVINIVEGSLMNFKVTTKDDIDLIKKLLK